VLASGTEETTETAADTSRIVANTPAGAISATLVTITIERIGTGRALLQVARRSAVSQITQATNMLHGVPRSGVHSAYLGSQVLFRPASPAVITVVGAKGSLTSNTFITGETVARTRFTITKTLVGALNRRMEIILVDNGTNPSIILGASTLRTIGTSPLRSTIKTNITQAIVIQFASSVTRTRILTKTTLSVATFVPSNLSPTFSNKGRSRRGIRGWFAGGSRWGHSWGRSRDLSRGRSRSISRKLSRSRSRGSCRDLSRGRSRDLSRDLSRGSCRDLSRSRSRDHSRDLSRSRSRDLSRGTRISSPDNDSI